MAEASYPKGNKTGLDADPAAATDVIDLNFSLVYIYTL